MSVGRTGATTGSRWVGAVLLSATLLLSGCGGGEPPGPSPRPSAADPAVLLEQALEANASGDTAGAKRRFEELLRQEPTNKLAAYNLGVLAQQAGDDAAAAGFYNKTLELDPAYAPALYNFAILTNKQGDPKGAAALYERAIKADPNDANAHYNYGLLLRRLGDGARAQSEIDKAIKLDPTLKQPAPVASSGG